MYLSLSLTPCLYFSICLSLSHLLPFLSPSVSISICLSLSLTRPLSVSISISPSFFSISLSLYLSIVSVSPSPYLSVSIHLFLILALIPLCPSILSSQLMSAMDTISGGPGTGKVVSLLKAFTWASTHLARPKVCGCVS